jgi:hypothetical protein
MVVDMFARCRAAAEYSVVVPVLGEGDPPVRIDIAAAGGGTMGERYAGNAWIYHVYCGGDLVVSGDDVWSSAVPAGHAEMAVTLAAFLSADGENIAYGGEDSDHVAAGYDAAGLGFLGAEGERLGVWAGHEQERAGWLTGGHPGWLGCVCRVCARG